MCQRGEAIDVGRWRQRDSVSSVGLNDCQRTASYSSNGRTLAVYAFDKHSVEEADSALFGDG